jgi:hypothetical protein
MGEEKCHDVQSCAQAQGRRQRRQFRIESKMIVCHGCSFTEGFYLGDKSLSWPSQLSKISGLTTKNHALGGSSNQRIARVLKEDLVNLADVDTVIIGWTSNARNELFSIDGDYIRATTGSCLGEKTDNQSNREHLDILHKNWLNYNHNIWLNYRQMIYDILFFQDYFESKKIRYKFFSAFENNMINDFLEKNNKSLELANHAWVPWNKAEFLPCPTKHVDWLAMTELVKKINLSNWILGNTETMISYLNKIGIKDRDAGGHPMENGHLAWAKLVLSEIT